MATDQLQVTARRRMRGAAQLGSFKQPTTNIGPTTNRRLGLVNFDTPAKKALMLEKLEEYLGIVVFSCHAAGVPRPTHYFWMANDPEYAAQVKDINEVALDLVEAQHLNNVKAGKEQSIIFYLKTKGRSRGYNDRVEHTGEGGGPIAFEGQVTVEQVREDLPLEGLKKVILRTLFNNAMPGELTDGSQNTDAQ